MGSACATVSSAQLLTRLNVTEDIQDAPGATGKTITSNYWNANVQQYSSSTTVPVTRYSAEEYTLVASAATIDLTDLSGTQGDIDGTGLKVQVFRISNPSTNSGAITVSAGASNGYELFGTGNSLEVPVGVEITCRFDDTLADVTSVSGVGEFNIGLAGTTDDVANVEILLG